MTAMNASNNLDEIVIQPDYWTGTRCLENAVPWQTPLSIYKEAENLKTDDVVLELGTGGSTIFLAKRCKHVIAIETDLNWAQVVQERLNQLGLINVTYYVLPCQHEIDDLLHSLNKNAIDVFSVDTVHGYSRSGFVDAFFEQGISNNFRMVVADNYASPELFYITIKKYFPLTIGKFLRMTTPIGVV